MEGKAEINKKAPLVAAVVLDIEGTTTSISFVADVLFPYIRRELRAYLTANWANEQTQQDVDNLRKLAEERTDLPHIPKEGSKEDLLEAAVKNVTAQMDVDLKSTALKALQGHMWTSGYASGELKGDIYPDVVPAINKWRELGLPIYIYSSGSIQAQKLLFGYSAAGDLLGHFSGHFDTTIGLKVEEGSYHKIAEQIKVFPSSNILFVTDNILEAVAADKAGWSVALSDRPGNKPLPDNHPFLVVTSFLDLWKEGDRFRIPFAYERKPRLGVAVCVTKNNKVLLGKRKGSHGSGVYAFTGGSIDYGEHWNTAGPREVKEETGLDLKNVRFSTLINDVAYGLHYVTVLLQAEPLDPHAEPHVNEPDKCEEWIWADWDNLPTPWFHAIHVLKAEGWTPAF